jgi:negative regulator of sigma E activity
MDWLEEELKAALAREDPPADFAGRVMRRAARPVSPWPRWLAAAAAVVLAAGAGVGYRQYRGEIAREQVMQAFRIASVKVNRIQARVREVSR